MNQPALSIIIVNWKSCGLLRNCLKSIYETPGHSNYEIVVIDNASFDGSEAMVQEEFPAVRFIQSQTNLGFARANNIASSYSCGKALLFLNPDTEVVGNALNSLESALWSLPDAGAVGPRLLNGDLTVQTSCVQAFPTIVGELLDANVLRKAFPKARVWGTQALAQQTPAPAVVDAVSGACLMIKREVFERAGQFTSTFFMYSEDLDLCFKTARNGYRNYYVSNARVIHFGGQSSAQAEDHFAAVMRRESLRAYFKMRSGTFSAWVYRSGMAVASLVRMMALIGVLFVAPRKKVFRQALRKWFFVLRWSLGLEGWAKSNAHASSS